MAGEETITLRDMNLVEASIDDLRHALSTGSLSSVELAVKCLRRASKYDARGPTLNAIPILNPSVFEEAQASDERRAAGNPLGRLEGIPFTVKDSYKVRGLTVAAGSDAFRSLVASDDAFIVKLLRDAGAVLIGKTNMPPMAYGGMQRGVYGRPESPYNLGFLTAAFASGSSTGSATSTTTSMAAFGLGGETVSSGRSPASNNGLVAYTPSRGLISPTGSWSLYPTCDVVVPHTRSLQDMFNVLDVIVTQESPPSVENFWRYQDIVSLPDVSAVRPTSYYNLADRDSLRGKRIAVPRMYIGGHDSAAQPVTIRQSVIDLWQQARRDLEALGAEIVETDFPLVTNYEQEAHAGKIFHVDGAPSNWADVERGPLIALGWEEFLRSNNDPKVHSLIPVNPRDIFPNFSSDDVHIKYAESKNAIVWSKLADHVKGEAKSVDDVPGLAQAVRALEAARKRDLEDWLDAQRLDFVVFPTNGDVGRADADVNDRSARHAWQNGVKYSNGNRAIRHLGVPTVTVTMGLMSDTRMPVGLTFAGKAYDDNNLLRYAFAFEQSAPRRRPPPLTPPLDTDRIPISSRRSPGPGPGQRSSTPTLQITKCSKSALQASGAVFLDVQGRVTAGPDGSAFTVSVYVDGDLMEDTRVDTNSGCWVLCAGIKSPPKYSVGTLIAVPRDKTLVLVMVKNELGRAAAKLVELE